MNIFTVDARDGVQSASCDTCCCEATTGRPGEKNGWTVNYAPWSVPLGGHGLQAKTEFAVTLKAAAGVPAYTNTHYGFSTDNQTPLVDSVATAISPAGVYEYELVNLQGPYNGSVVINPATGSFTYTPNGGYQGYDTFWYSTKTATGDRIYRQVQIHVIAVGGVAAIIVPSPPGVAIETGSVVINQRQNLMTFPIVIDHIANAGDIYMLEIKAVARDCDGVEYHHVSCYDITIGKCR